MASSDPSLRQQRLNGGGGQAQERRTMLRRARFNTGREEDDQDDAERDLELAAVARRTSDHPGEEEDPGPAVPILPHVHGSTTHSGAGGVSSCISYATGSFVVAEAPPGLAGQGTGGGGSSGGSGPGGGPLARGRTVISTRALSRRFGPGADASVHVSKRPSDLHMWIEPGLDDEELQRERRLARRRELLESLLHRPRVPGIDWIRRYNVKRDLFWDLQAGLVVGILLLPQGMAYATLANLTPIFGLYCATIPNITYAFFGPSRESAVGAMALVSIMVGDTVLSHTGPGAPLEERVNVAVKLCFLTGIFQVALGLLKMGEIATYVSHPVMQGFCSGGEILIAISQLKYLFGIKIPQYKYAYQTVAYLCNHIKETQPYTLLLGLVTFAALYAVSKWRRATKARVEREGHDSVSKAKRTMLLLANFGPFLAIVLTAFVAYGMDQQGVGPAVIGKVPHGLHTFPAHAITGQDLQKLAGPAALMAVISFMLTYSVSKKYANLNKYEVDCNQELLALGLSDFLGSFFGAFPVAGGFARTAVAVEANQKTQLSAIIAASIVLLAVNFLTGSFYWIPQCTLAAIVQVAICGVVDFRPFLYAWRASKSEWAIMTTAFLVTLGLGVDKGILAGVALSVVALVRRTSHPRLVVLGVVTGRRHAFRDVTRYPNAVQPPGVVIMRIDESINFASCASIKEQILRIAQDPSCVGPPTSTASAIAALRAAAAGIANAAGYRKVSGPNGEAAEGEAEVGAEGAAARAQTGTEGECDGGPSGGGRARVESPVLAMVRSLTNISGLTRDMSLASLRRGRSDESVSEALTPKPKPKHCILDFSGVNHLDLSGIKILDECQAALERDEQVMYVVNVKSTVRDKLQASPIWHRLGGDLVFLSLPALLDYVLGTRDWAGGDAPQVPMSSGAAGTAPAAAAAAAAAAADKGGENGGGGSGAETAQAAGGGGKGKARLEDERLAPAALKALDSLYSEYVDWEI